MALCNVDQCTPFVIVATARNNTRDVIGFFKSVVSQDYPAFRVVYLDDSSTDETIHVLDEWLAMVPQYRHLVTIVKVKTRIYACAGRDMLLRHYAQPYEVAVCVDGDDKLIDSHVLTYLDGIYRDSNVWMTYGGFVCSDGKHKDYGDWTPQEKLIAGGCRLSGRWYANHPRTFRVALYLLIDQKDLKDSNDQWWTSATDQAMAFPLLEMAGSHATQVRDRKLYIYTIHEGQQYAADRVAHQQDMAKQIRSLLPYQPLKKLLYWQI